MVLKPSRDVRLFLYTTLEDDGDADDDDDDEDAEEEGKEEEGKEEETEEAVKGFTKSPIRILRSSITISPFSFPILSGILAKAACESECNDPRI